MTGALGAVSKSSDEPSRESWEIDNGEVVVETEEEPCQRCGQAPREEVVKISVRGVTWIIEVCRPCAMDASRFLRGDP